MQTFLPWPDPIASVAALDRLRLGKQRVEALQLARGQWPRHPASVMWRGHLPALVAYGAAACEEWTCRGYRDTCLLKLLELAEPSLADPPPWLGDPTLHLSHRSNLLRKLPEHYAPLFEAGLRDDLPYVWLRGAGMASTEELRIH